MKAFLTILFVTFSLGTAISLHFGPSSVFYLPLYALALFHLYRVNITEGFFLVFLEKPIKEEIARIRLGSTEIEIKDEADRNEDKFLSLFDWKRSTVRKILSWSVFCASIYLLFFRIHLDISAETIFPVVTALLLMRVVAVGHLLIPLAMNLLFVLKDIPDFQAREWTGCFIYGLLLITNLALIYPSEERIGRKLREWLSGKWREIARTALILLLTFTAGLFIFPKKFEAKKPPEVPQLEIDRSEKNLRHLESSLKNLMGTGLMKQNILDRQFQNLKQDISDFNKSGHRSPEEWKELKARQEKLESKFNGELTGSPKPALSPALLEMMKNDLKSRSGKGISPETYKKMGDLLEKMNNFKGGSGDDLISEYRDLKFGKGGYYNEETEMDAGGAPDPASADILKKMAESTAKKKEVSDLIEKNVEKLKASPDEGLEAVNDALKNELNEADSLSVREKETITRELQKTKDEQGALKKLTTDPELSQKLTRLMDENQKTLNQMTPHMNAAEKSLIAQKLQSQKAETSALKNQVRDEVALKVENREKIRKKSEEESVKPENKFFEKVLRLGSILAFGMLALWFFSLFKKKGVKRVRGVPEEVLEEIRDRLRDVKKRNLSPREEVIETYNVLHDGLHTLVFARETPPSCIVYEGLSAAEPELRDPTYTVTDLFARTFYGDHDVSDSDLRAFRKDVKKVFSFFDIRIS